MATLIQMLTNLDADIPYNVNDAVERVYGVCKVAGLPEGRATLQLAVGITYALRMVFEHGVPDNIFALLFGQDMPWKYLEEVYVEDKDDKTDTEVC